MGKTRILAALLALLLLIALAAGCSATKSYDTAMEDTASSAPESNSSTAMDWGTTDTTDSMEMPSAEPTESASAEEETALDPADFSEKIIYSGYLTMQTTKFDEALRQLEETAGIIADELNVKAVEFCADGRTVKSMPIFKDVRLTDDDGEDFVFCAYVSGDLLDENVNDLRTDFSIQEHKLDPEEVSMDEIVDEVRRQCKGYLGKALNRDEVRRRERIESISKAYPEIGLICRRDPTIVDGINADMSEQDLYGHINRCGADMDTAAMFDIKDLIGRKTRIYEDDVCEEIMSRIDDFQRNTLARYVIGRRMVIEMLEKGMRRSEEDGGFPLESYIHDIMLPRGTDPDSPPDVNSCNLWLLDERMNYYAFGGAFSDVYMRRITGDDNQDRPDVVVFSEIADGVSRSVALVEFKRYDRKDNDMEIQIKRYVMKIRKAGHIELESGRKIALTSETTFHCFGVCDLLTGYGDELAASNYTRVYGGRGYYQWFPLLNASIEFIDYSKVASDAKLRNEVFFDILGIKDV